MARQEADEIRAADLIRQAEATSDSLDSLLSQFEIIQTAASTELQQPIPPPRSPLASFFQRSTFPQTREPTSAEACIPITSHSHFLRRSPGAATRVGRQLHPAVHLREDSPAVASASHQQPYRSSLCGSLSLESLNTLSTSSEEHQQASGEEVEQQLFPLGEALSALYRPASEASLTSQPTTATQLLLRPQLSIDTQQGVRCNPADETAAAPILSQATGLTSKSRGAESTEEGLRLPVDSALSPLRITVQQQPSAGCTVPPPVSPFAAVAVLPPPESVSSLESSSFKSSKSASDYGSHNPGKEWQSVTVTGKDRGHAVDYVKPENAYGQPPPSLRPLSHIEYREKFAQGRSHLRKRDYESELLERLLSRGPRGPGFGHYSRPLIQDAKLTWRALGFPKMAFVTIIFLCLALFLLVFSAGRMHAHKILRAMPLAPLAGDPTTALPMGVSIPGALPEELAVARKHHMLAAAASHETLHLDKPSLEDASGTDTLTAHERRQGFTQRNSTPDTRKRLVLGFRMLEPKL